MHAAPLHPIIMCCDNKATIYIAKNKKISNKMKHISMKYHYIRRMVKKGKVVIEYLPTELMLTDPLTKRLTREKLSKALK